MVSVVVFKFSGMRCQPLRRALYALGISEQDVFDTSNIGCYLPVI
ncbi:acetyltransferase [Vibrio cholerae]